MVCPGRAGLLAEPEVPTSNTTRWLMRQASAKRLPLLAQSPFSVQQSASVAACCLERLIEVFDQVIRMLQTDRKTQEVLWSA